MTEQSATDVTLTAYQTALNDLYDVAKVDKREVPELLGKVEEWRIMAGNYAGFFRKVARIARCTPGDETDVLTALGEATDLKTTEIEKIKEKRLSQFSKSDLFLALITKIVRRR